VVANARLKVNEISADDSTSVSIKSPLQLDSTLQVVGTINANGTGNSILVSDTLRIAQNGSGLRMTNVGAFDNDGSDNFRIFSTNDLIFSSNGDSNTAMTIDGTTQDVTINQDLGVTGNIRGGSLRADNFTTQNAFAIVGSDNNLIQDTTLSVDPDSNFLGINQTSPEVTLHMTGEGAQTAQIRMEQYNNSADAPDVRTRRYRGTIASPLAINSGDYLYRSNHEYWNGSALIVGGTFAFDNTNNAERTQFAVSVTTDGTSADANTPSKVQFKIDGNDSGAITFNNAYKFPTTDGSANQFLQTDGGGAITFASATVSDISDLTANATELNLLDGVTGTLVTEAGSQTLTNKTLGATTISGNILPDTTETYDIGSSTLRFNDIYLAGSTVDIGGTKLSKDANGDLDIKDASDVRKTIKAAAIELFDTDGKAIKIERDATSGKMKTRKFGSDGSEEASQDVIDISEDRSPKLGGDLDLNSNNITGTGDVNITGDGAFSGNVTVTGNLTVNGTTTTVNSTQIDVQNAVRFEGATADEFETVLTVTDPTADRTITLPDSTGTVVLADTTDTLTNKTLTTPDVNTSLKMVSSGQLQFRDNQSYITENGGILLFNGAAGRGVRMYSGGTERVAVSYDGNLELKTGVDIIFEGATSNDFETILTVTDPTADRTVTLPDETGTVALTSNLPSTTDDLSEGSSNLYYTDARARASVSVTDAGGDGSLSYNSSSGVITYTGPSAAEVRAHISGGTGVTISSGEIAIGQSVATTADVTFNSVVTNTINTSDSSALTMATSMNINGTLSATGSVITDTITTDGSNSDINISANGTGAVVVESLQIQGNQITATDSTQIAFGQQQLTNVADPTSDQDVATKAYVDNNSGSTTIGFTNSTTTEFPTFSDSSATDFSNDEPEGVGTAASGTDAFGVALSGLYDCMEPSGSLLTNDFGSSESHVGA
jgi:hypothetical protein